ncbi:MAG: ABC transporter ATP-binding protein [Acidimicrobiales bacterium]
MSSPPAVELVDVDKAYLRQTEQRSILSTLVPGRTKGVEHLAVRDLDLRLEQGETVGVLGHNGAGKTTLLRLLAGVTQPSRGRVRVAGRIAPLLSVGVGFHQEMTGRENVLLNGMLLGRSRAEVLRDLEAIVQFSGLHDVLDTPVKFYSSGMLMRLGFSVAMFSRPNVLLVDEVLAVGDAAFQLKCIERMQQLQAEGTTLILVSHSVHVARLMCPRAIVMHHGRKVFDGPSEEAVAVHNRLLTTPLLESDAEESRQLEVLGRSLLDERGQEPTELELGGRYTLRYRLRFREEVESPHVKISATSTEGVLTYLLISTLNTPYRHFAAGEEVDLEVAFVANMGGGTYRLAVEIHTMDESKPLWMDGDGTLVYRPPALGTYGVADLDASISLGGHEIHRHPSLMLGDAES